MGQRNARRRRCTQCDIMGRTLDLEANLEPAVLRRHLLQGVAKLLLEHIAVKIEIDEPGVVLDAAEEALDNLHVCRVIAAHEGVLGLLKRELDLVLLLLLRLLRAGQVGLAQGAKLLRDLGAQGGNVREARTRVNRCGLVFFKRRSERA